MHVLLLAADAATAETLADAWRAAAAGTVEPAVLPAAEPDGDERDGGRRETGGVLVPVAALGLTRAHLPAHPQEERLRRLVAAADLVVVHVERLDAAALRAAPLGLAGRVAGERALPVVVLAGRSEVARREWSAAGVSGVHVVGADGPEGGLAPTPENADGVGDGGAAAAVADGGRAARVARAARTWAPRWA
ncbi:hypothetical protein DNL40_06565 [Xylanimonas oleitrophica]|uniref:Uncharacterized protein n=1 Tax=Xylanimonas oleitrophica TaxID=2607479 RepID=A0A2W5YGF0_9MICO|nr:hypothetical protein [Xylanimonas oleitrophica]PZR53781.1 hypothetical protein DNL40_06565 [Xylanimonas oleitrophica]